MGYRYDKYKENNICAELPCEIDGEPVTIIGAKAFLSYHMVETLILPDSLESVEDWAFAHMKGLKELWIPAKRIVFGRKVFLGCGGLGKVILTCRKASLQGQYEGMPYFLASVFRLSLHDIKKELADLSLAGMADGQWQWLAFYDEALAVYLMRADDFDFQPAFIGWFDVEDVDDQKAGYIAEQIKKKIEIVLQRLVYSEGITRQTEKLFGEYLVEKVSEQTLDLLRDSGSGYGRSVKYFQIWQHLGGFKRYSPGFLLEQLEDADPEVRSFLLECQLEETAEGAFFGSLEL